MNFLALVIFCLKMQPCSWPLLEYSALCLYLFLLLVLGGSDGKESACNAGGLGSIPGLGRSPGKGCYPLQYICLENPLEREAWWAVVHSVAESQKDMTEPLPL